MKIPLKQIGLLVAKVAPQLVKKIGKVTDGKKTVTGAAITLGGIVCAVTPGASGVALDLFYVGVPLLVGGLWHKLVKRGKTKKENE